MTPDPVLVPRPDGPDRLAGVDPSVAALVGLGRLSLDQPLGQYLQRVADLAQRALPAVEALSVLLVDQGRARSVAVTSPVAALLDERQHENDFGPGLRAAASGERVVLDLAADETSYPAFAGVARRHGVRAAAALPLGPPDGVVGVLTLYCSDGGLLTPQALTTAAEVAASAAVALENVSRHVAAVVLSEQLTEAMRTRAVIEQAKGVVMAQHAVGTDEAWTHLSRTSQETNVKVHDVAAAVVARAQRGEVPSPPLAARRAPGAGQD